jgi:tetratricopeptide (TPR) repeat protein
MRASRLIVVLAIVALMTGDGSAQTGPGQPPVRKTGEHCVPIPIVPPASPASARQDGRDAPLAPLLKGLGSLHYKVTTTSDRAQTFFDQGLRLVYAFNHLEAIRSFREAARLDPGCGMCYWGESYALGPNINDPITPEREAEAYTALQKAMALKDRLTETERGFIDALSTRYSTGKHPDRRKFDAAFARAMQQFAARYPNDPEVMTIYVASVMETRPWEYWRKNDEPQPGIKEALAALESVLRQFPDHPGGHHYYIHMVEATSTPDRGVPSADKLESLMPGAGHMVHMPSHIYMRVGRYADASAHNERAVLADEDYIAQCQAQGLYPVAYYPHNIHFLWSSSTMEGRSEVAIDAARKVAAKIPHELAASGLVPLQDFIVTPYYALIRFGRWSEMLTEAEPAKDLAFVRAMWHYGRGIAFTARGQIDRAAAELAAMRGLRSHASLDGAELAGTKLTTLIDLAGTIVEGEMAAKQGRTDEAVKLFEEAVKLQDGFRYNEPPTWHYPVRQSLGAVLLSAGRAKEAAAVYAADLAANRENGWSLFGLARALAATGRTDEAAAVESRFRRAWARADVALASSRF